MPKLLIALLLILSTAAWAQEPCEKRLALLLDAFNANNYETVEKFIHPDTGLYILYKTGAYSAFTRFNTLNDFKNWFSSYQGRGNTIFCTNCAFSNYTVKLGLPPYFNMECGGVDESAERNTLYLENTSQQAELSTAVSAYSRQIVEHFDARPLPEATIEKIKSLETFSYRAAAVNLPFILYLTLIDGEWYLTALAVGDSCDA